MRTQNFNPGDIPEPALARFLFANTSLAWLWLIVRLYCGWQWFVAGLEKLTGTSYDLGAFGEAVRGGRWVFTDHDGAVIVAFAKGALQKAPGGRLANPAHPDVQPWYAWFLQHIVIPNAGFFAYLVTFGEVLVGICLILGLFTGIAAFFGVFMNANYLLAGTVSSNPVLLILGALLMMAWRVAGYYGLDRFALPLLGTPEMPGRVLAARRRIAS
jgi:thiosulfate dehydrogenase [quinone] large subunit